MDSPAYPGAGNLKRPVNSWECALALLRTNVPDSIAQAGNASGFRKEEPSNPPAPHCTHRVCSPRRCFPCLTPTANKGPGWLFGSSQPALQQNRECPHQAVGFTSGTSRKLPHRIFGVEGPPSSLNLPPLLLNMGKLRPRKG